MTFLKKLLLLLNISDEGRKAVPYVLIGDDAFSLSTRIQKPYTTIVGGRHRGHFNYRLSRARNVVECAFGIMTERFHCLRHAMGVVPETVELAVKTCCMLHNMLREQNPENRTVWRREDGYDVP